MVTILGIEVSKKDAPFAGFSGYMAFSGNLLENGRKTQGGYFFIEIAPSFLKPRNDGDLMRFSGQAGG